MPSRLTADQQGSYQEDGYLKFDQPVFSQEKFDALKAHVESQIVAWTEVLQNPPELIDRIVELEKNPSLVDGKKN